MKKTRTGFSVAVLAAAILLLLQFVPTVLAQDQNYDQDPPTRAGRIGYVEGSVSFQPGGVGDWLQAVPNRPLTVGDNLWVDRDSRADIQLGSTSVRLGPETSITFLDLGNNVTQLRLSVGSLSFRVRRYTGDDAFEVDTPNLAFNVDRPGEYRLDVNQNGDQTDAVIWRGEAEVTGAGNSYRLTQGQRGTFSGVDQLSYNVDDVGGPDTFDRWAQSRDERQDRFRSSEYVSTEMTGYDDLDDYGRWRSVEGYGNVWTPTQVAGDWAPYRYGHWVYVSPWGWTWVEDEPWGFAPFHYGRWAYLQSSWCWVPGPVAVAPVYAPALVAFVGGGGFSIGVGVGGGVGWFPLGPGDVFVPWYRSSPRYVQNVNVTNTRVNVTQVTNVYNNYTTNHVTNVTYVNQRVNNSVTVVNHDTFVNARPVNRNIMRVDNRQIASARVTPASLSNLQPARQSVMGASRPVQVRPPEQAMRRPVVATRQPVIVNRPPEVPNLGRATPPPIRTVRAAPPAQAQPLQRGARGTGGAQGQNEASPRPGAPDNNRGGARPGAPDNNRPATGNDRGAAPRPGAPDNRPGAENNRGVARPGAPDNNPAAPRPGNPGNNRPGAGNDRGPAPQPGTPDNRPGAENNRGVARPAAPDNNNNPNTARPGAPENQPGPGNNRGVPRPGAPENNRDIAPRSGGPDNGPGAAPRPNAPPRPGAPDNNRGNAPSAGAPENRPVQPENRPAPPDSRSVQPDNRGGQQAPRAPAGNRQPDPIPEQPRQNPNARPQNTRPQETPRATPEQPARPPEARQAPPPPPRPDTRSQPPPRPEARPAQPPPQQEARPAQPRNERPGNPPPSDDRKNNKDKEPPKYR
jgi:hypothetical protein